MNQNTLFKQNLQFACGAVRAKRLSLEGAMLNGWDADTSRTIDACVHAEEALATLEAIETAGALATLPKTPAQNPTRALVHPPSADASRLDR